MIFNSIHFIIFFPFITALYFLIPQRHRYIWLLLASYYFYMSWNVKYVILLFFSTFVTYLCGILIDNINSSTTYTEEKKIFSKKFYIAGSFLSNLAILFFFKYANMIFSSVDCLLANMGIKLLNYEVDILLPVGISFYIFQALGYTIDVYRNEIKAERNFAKYALFVSFFPALIAGPIERSKNLLQQISEEHFFDYERAKKGLLLMLWVFFQKLVIADRAAIVVNTVYNNPYQYTGFYIVLATFFFAFQIYCDFAGYTNIARGSAQVLGFDLIKNFNTPYFSCSISEFWHRWHISLSTWFRDYMYIPLGGSRLGAKHKYINIMIVFLTSGLWHGANWNFVVWGGIHGFFLIASDAIKPFYNSFLKTFAINIDNFSHKLLKIIVTFFLVDLAWLFFRANNIDHAWLLLRQMVKEFNIWIFFDGSVYLLGLDRTNFYVLISALVILLLTSILKYNNFSVIAILMKQQLWFRWSLYILFIIYLMAFGLYMPDAPPSEFIYFQF